MSGIIRWRDLQNIFVTENQINLLAGLVVNAGLLNQLDGFSGSGEQLNQAIQTISTINTHVAKDLATAHSLTPNSIDGGVISDGTLAMSKLSFSPLTQADYLNLNNLIDALNTEHSELSSQVENLYSVLFPSVTGDIAQQFDQLVNHIEKLEDAHDAIAISYGNTYDIIQNTPVGALQTKVSTEKIKEFRVDDEVQIQDSNSGPETRTLTGVDYNTGTIAWAGPLVNEYSTNNSPIVKNNSQKHVQQTIERSLRNSTDNFTGRLTIDQLSNNDALVINKSGNGYTARFNDFTSKTDQSFDIELGSNDGSTRFRVANSDGRHALDLLDNGELITGNVTLSDYNSLEFGKITKQDLTDDREWKLPDRSGYIGLGDLTFTELLKVSTVPGTKKIKIAPGYKEDYDGRRVSAWISMETPCSFEGTEIDIQAKFLADNKLLTLEDKWQVFVVYINDDDNVSFFHGPQEATRQEALDEYFNFIPSAYMKLAKFVVQGDGLGGILQSSIEFLQDQRPFLTQGMSAAYYDETINSPTGWNAGSVISLPANSKAGGMIQSYKPGRGQLEVYLDGVYQVVDQDYEETVGEPVGRIRVLKNIASHSQLHFRITYKAAAITGGFDVPTLQTAYNAGPLISVSDIVGPVRLMSFDTDMLMELEGSVSITNKIHNLRSLAFQKISALSTDLDKNQIYVDNNSDLIYHQYKTSGSRDYNILKEIEEAQSVSKIPMMNGAGSIIPKGRAVALHPSLPNAVVLCDTSSNTSKARAIGITTENIGIGEVGNVAISGLFKLAGLGLPHNSVLVVDPRNPGHVVPKNSVSYLPTDEYMEIGLIDGGHLLVQLLHNPKVKAVWKVGIAGESFNANETRLVRFAIDGETRGRVYKADKAMANAEQKFWAVAAVRPSVAIAAGDPVDLIKDVELHSSELAFSDQDVGKPLYLGNNGEFKSWRLLNGSFTMGDAAIKIGMIEDRRKFIVDGAQMMGTAPGATF